MRKKICISLISFILLTGAFMTNAFSDTEATLDNADAQTVLEVGKGIEIMPHLKGSEFEVEHHDLSKSAPREIMSRSAFSLLSFGTQSLELEPLALPTGGPYFGNFTGKSGLTAYLYRTSTTANNYTYVENYSRTSGVVPILDQANGRYKIAISGTIGWIEESVLELIPYASATGYNYYYRNENNELIHRISLDAKTNNYAGLVQGKAPDYVKANTKYLSFDGNYFYQDSLQGFQNLIDDYNANSRSKSVNATTPYYNYFQYLPARTQTQLTANDLKRYLVENSDGSIAFSTPFESRLVETEEIFINSGHIFGSNAALAFSSGIHESGWGKSYFAKARNNFFGHGAFDSAPGLAKSYNSPSIGIANHFGRFLNWNYLDATPGNWIYNGGFVGNKELGMNVKYASDPYWGEKIAAHYFNMDKKAGYKDYNLYTLGLTNKNNVDIRKEAKSSAPSVYKLSTQGMVIALTNTIKEGSNTWYQHSSEALLTSSKDLEPWPNNLSKIFNSYNIAKSQLYVNANDIKIVNTGTNSKVYPQANVKFEGSPNFNTEEVSVYTLKDVSLFPDWSTRYTPILTIPKGTKITGITTDNGWLHVIYAYNKSVDYIGYVSLKEVSLTKGGKPIDNIEIEPPAPDPLPQPGTIEYTVNASAGLNMRTSPKTGSVITTINNGSKVTGGKPLDGWVHISYQGKTGYVSVDFLKEVTVTPPVTPPTNNVKLGDINGDAKISVSDMAMLQAHLRGTYTLKGDQLKAADINKDGKISVSDMAMLQAHLRKVYTINGW